MCVLCVVGLLVVITKNPSPTWIRPADGTRIHRRAGKYPCRAQWNVPIGAKTCSSVAASTWHEIGIQ